MQIIIPTLHYYPDCANGADRLAYDEAMYLADQGHEVWLVAQDLSGERPEHCFENGFHILRYPSLNVGIFSPRRLWTHQAEVHRLLSKYLEKEPDLVHGHSLLTYHGTIRHFKRGVKNCYSVHSPVKPELKSNQTKGIGSRTKVTVSSYLSQRLEAYCLTNSCRVTVFSNYTKKLLAQYYNEDIAQKAEIISGWVDTEKFRILSNRKLAKKTLGWPIEVPILFTLRRLVPRMGLDKLLYAAQEVKRSGHDFQLVIGGQGPMRNELEDLGSRMGLDSFVRFEGFVSEEDLPLMYGAADAFVLPTTALECFGIIALEALACGCPVLATPVGAIPELLRRFEPKWLAYDENVQAIACIINDFLEKKLPKHEPEYLRKIVKRDYERDHVLAIMTNFLSECMTN